MRSALRRLETIHAETATSGEERAQTAAESAEREKDKRKKLAKLSPYKQCEYRCLEGIQTLREALKECRETAEALRTLEGDAAATKADTLDPDRTAASRGDGAAAAKKVKLTASDMNRRTVLQQQLARSRQAARRAHHKLQKMQKEAHALSRTNAHTSSKTARPHAVGGGGAGAEEEEEGFRILNGHIESAKRFYREEFNITVVTSLDDPLLQNAAGAGSGEGAPLLGGIDGEADGDESASRDAVASNRARRLHHLFGSRDGSGVYPTRPGLEAGHPAPNPVSREEQPSEEALAYRNAREDAEFQQFFLEVKQNDELMDQALDRISAGVHRLRDNAVGLQEELNVQAVLLDQTEVKIERNQEDLHQMNRRLRHAIRELEDSSVCSYVLCLLALLLVFAVLVKVAG